MCFILCIWLCFKKTSIDVYKAIEPISKKFLDKYNESKDCEYIKEDIILYNPAKCYKIIKKLIKYDKNIDIFH